MVKLSLEEKIKQVIIKNFQFVKKHYDSDLAIKRAAEDATKKIIEHLNEEEV